MELHGPWKDEGDMHVGIHFGEDEVEVEKTGTVMLPEKWESVVETVDFAFQPIVNSLTGVTFAVEALLRNYREADFAEIPHLFDAAFNEGVLYSVDVALRRKALRKFVSIPFHRKIRLFYNYDLRVHAMDNYRYGVTENLIQELNLTNDIICFELSERHHIKAVDDFKNFLAKSRRRGFSIALDDFGVGFAGFELLYNTEPDFLKFDRFLIRDIDSDIRKKTFCTHIMSIARLLGVVVIVEGVETEKEFLTCRDMGCELMQGYFIQRPTTEVLDLTHSYVFIREMEMRNKRKNFSSADLVMREITPLEKLNVNDDIQILFKRFNRNSETSFFPVVDSNNYPLGIIHERSIKKYIYAPYGYDLLRNKSLTASLQMFIEKCPVVDVHTPQEKLIEIFAANPASDGILITDGLRYLGFLTAKSLLAILNERNLATARELNPLSYLPGNTLINRYMAGVINGRDNYYYFVYFDFDNFKPFNDRFGFRQGDRVILLFAEILKKKFNGEEFFVGHVGGDDFFVGIRRDTPCMEHQAMAVREVMEAFNAAAASFYSPEDFERGGYMSRDREGKERRFPLLTVSAAIVEIPAGARLLTHEEIAPRLARLKNAAKNRADHLSTFSLADAAVEGDGHVPCGGADSPVNAP